MRKEWKWILFYCFTISTVVLGVRLGNHVVSTMAENRPAERRHCVIIDPGHGGEDGGAISFSGLPESGYNLDISMRLNDLMQLLGYDTKMIRETDISIYKEGKSLSQKKISDLRERVRIVSETKGAVLLSIHQNHYPDKKYSGAQVFYADTQESEILAKQLQSAMASTLNSKSSRQAKKSSGVYLMEHISCPGVLIECGFLSNPEEDAKLRSPEYQKKICCVITATVSQYLSNA